MLCDNDQCFYVKIIPILLTPITLMTEICTASLSSSGTYRMTFLSEHALQTVPRQNEQCFRVTNPPNFLSHNVQLVVVSSAWR